MLDYDGKWRLLKNWGFTVAEGSALTEHLIYNAPSNPPTLSLYTVPLTLVLGGNQNPHNVDIERAKKDGIPIKRRSSLGSTVLISPKQLVYIIVIGRKYYDCHKLVLFDFIQRQLFKVIEGLGIEGKLAPERISEEFANPNCMMGIGKNEILNKNGKKLISGSCSQYMTAYVQEGIIIIDKDIRDVSKYIKEDEWVTDRRQVFQPSSLDEELGKNISPEEVAKTLYNIFNLEEDFLREDEINNMKSILKQKYDSDEWIFSKGSKRKKIE